MQDMRLKILLELHKVNKLLFQGEKKFL